MSPKDTPFQELPALVDYRRVAKREASFQARLPVVELDRLADISSAESDDDEHVDAVLSFFEDDQRWAHVSGRVEYVLMLTCCRCQGPVEYTGSIVVDGVVVNDDDQAARVPRHLEPTMAGPDGLDIRALITDEVLLALPQALHCDRPDCRAEYESATASHGNGTDGDRWRPFENLRG